MPSDDDVLTWDSGLASNQKWAPATGTGGGVEVKDAGTPVGTRAAINFIEGANVTITIADDAGNDEVDVTIASSGGGGGGTGYQLLVPTGQTALDHPKWPNTGNPLLRLLFFVPGDWDGSSDFTVKMYRRSSSAAGTTVMDRYSYLHRDAAAENNFETAVGMNFTPGDTNSHLTSFTIAAATLDIDDTVRMDFTRTSGSGSDTNTGSVDYDGAWVEYTKA